MWYFNLSGIFPLFLVLKTSSLATNIILKTSNVAAWEWTEQVCNALKRPILRTLSLFDLLGKAQFTKLVLIHLTWSLLSTEQPFPQGICLKTQTIISHFSSLKWQSHVRQTRGRQKNLKGKTEE